MLVKPYSRACKLMSYSPHTDVAKPPQYLSLPALAMLCMVLGLIAPTFSAKEIATPLGIYPFGPFLGAFFFLAIDIIAEIYGYKIAMKFFWGEFICRFIYSWFFSIFILFESPFTNVNDSAYHHLFNGYISSGFIALAVGFTAWFINIKLMTRWRILTKGKYFWLRSVGASSIGETVALYLMVPGWMLEVGLPFSKAIHLVFYASILRIFLTAVFAVPCVFIANFLKQTEGIGDLPKSTTFQILDLKYVMK